MGGYGALKYALSFPERFAGCGAVSSMPDLYFRIGATPKDTQKYNELQGIFGMDPKPDESEDLYKLAEKTAALPNRPELFITCGTEDELYPLNIRFCAHLDKLGYAHTFQSWPGIHEWGFWDASLQKAMQHFFG
jgi:S-formylglutathione hydrolase FrmB